MSHLHRHVCPDGHVAFQVAVPCGCLSCGRGPERTELLREGPPGPTEQKYSKYTLLRKTPIGSVHGRGGHCKKAARDYLEKKGAWYDGACTRSRPTGRKER